MMLLGIPVYVCSAASIPIAAALMLKGVSPGAALAFLITGPVTNAATIATVWKLLGRRTAFLYLATVFAAAVGLGLLLNTVFALTGISSTPPLADIHVHAEGPGIFRILSAFALLGVLVASFFGRRSPREDNLAGRTEAAPNVRLTISGMTCDHCARSVRGALARLPGVREVRVDLSAGQAVVTGEGLDPESLCRAVRGSGYDASVSDL
jgi:copper chaperone CopZ